MAGTVKHARLESPSARNRLKRGRQPHWQALVDGKVHLGWQCWKGDAAGRWVLRRYIGNRKYRVTTLGLADDAAKADGARVLSFEQAAAKGSAMVEAPNNGKIERLTVRQAIDRYIEHKRDQGQPVHDIISRGTAHILPSLGDLVVAELTPEQLRKWLATMAAAPAQNRPKAGKLQYREAPNSDDAVRARRASANRVLTMLKAALNHAYDEGHVGNRDAWGRKLKPFENVEVARVRYLTVDEATRLINASNLEFRPLVQAALETGCRYSELARLNVVDFQIVQQLVQKNGHLEETDVGQVTIRKSKTGKPRHVTLTPEGAEFFQQHCAGGAGNEPMFHHADGKRWEKSEQARPMREACEHAKIKPRISFHILRHTWASLSIMRGVPLLAVATNLGHKDTRMVEKHYGHLAPSYITEVIHAGAPRFGIAAPTSVVPLYAGKSKRK
jgi:integrase